MLIEGKTKTIEKGPEQGTVFLVTKDSLTAGDALKKATIDQIGLQKTKQTSLVFSYLNKQNIPTAFIKQENDKTILCDACEMLPLEFVVRRYGWGSYLKRQQIQDLNKPLIFNPPKFELFHKHSVVALSGQAAHMMTENEARELYLTSEGWKEGVYTDPLIEREGNEWHFYPGKDPSQNGPLLSMAAPYDNQAIDNIIKTIIEPSFLALEKAWLHIETTHGPVHLADIKFEVGMRESDGRFVLADVIDNDSWRIWPGGNPQNQLDKQCFRDGYDLEEVDKNYVLVTKLLEQF